MWEFCTISFPVARRDYRCEASDFASSYSESDLKSDLSESEFLDYLLAKTEGFKIIKGTRYKKITGKVEGKWVVFRARIDIDEICSRNYYQY